MFKKFSLILVTTIALTFNVNAGSDGDLILNKNKPSEVKIALKILTEQLLNLTKHWMEWFLNLWLVYTENYHQQQKLE